jgi:hypothetical protein
MQRSINTSSLMIPTSEKYKVTQNYCPLPPRKKNTEQPIETPSEIDLLLVRYRDLTEELNRIRGKLYTQGINPDK